jgi:hypothetical protein
MTNYSFFSNRIPAGNITRMDATNSMRHWLKPAVFLLVFAGGTAQAADPAAGIKARMPAEWSACSADSDCSLLLFNCGDFLAVNGKHLSEARELAYQIEHNPAVMNCELAPGTQPPKIVAACAAHRCEVLVSPKRGKEP